MSRKHNDTVSTNIFHHDQPSNSFNMSQIFSQSNYGYNKRLSHSLEYFKSPYKQVLPIKFTNRRIRGQCQHHILQQTQVNQRKPCVKISGLKNKQCDQTIWRQQLSKQKFKQDIFPSYKKLSNIYNHSNSLQTFNNYSPSKNSKKIYLQKIITDCIKDPILVGQELKIKTGVKIHPQKYTQGLLKWNINQSVSKQRFKQKYNNSSKNTNNNNNAIKIQDNLNSYRYSTASINRKQKARTYKQLYESRKHK